MTLLPRSIHSMMTRSLVGALGLGLASTACIINTTNSDGDDVGETSDDLPATTGTPDETTGSVDGTGDGTTGGTTGGPSGECGDNLVANGGFEDGQGNEAWVESSMVFETIICDAGCTMEPGAAPHGGDWWVWFGGLEDTADVASISQSVTIDPEMAYLEFWFQIRSGSGTGNDTFSVELDGQTIWMVSDADMPDYGDYTRVSLDVSDWADGGTYDLTFSSEHAGVGLTSFFLDDVSLVSCVEPGGTDSSGTGGPDSTGDSTGGTEGSTGGSGTGGMGGTGGSGGPADSGGGG